MAFFKKLFVYFCRLTLKKTLKAQQIGIRRVPLNIFREVRERSLMKCCVT